MPSTQEILNASKKSRERLALTVDKFVETMYEIIAEIAEVEAENAELDKVLEELHRKLNL